MPAPENEGHCTGFFVSDEDIKHVYAANKELHAYSPRELARGIHTLKFMGIMPEYIVTRQSVFYSYFEKEGRKEVCVIS
ncbi:MAG: hypothetical protein HY645_13430 [Acidobacteria bacterium]|nr:hypothetical protein [Acidobacteriota bacterium]